jgi:hypothetical protein
VTLVRLLAARHVSARCRVGRVVRQGREDGS